MEIKKFTKEELKAVVLIFIVLIVISIPNFMLSIRRSRDQNRRDDIGGLQSGLMAFYADFGVFPKSSDKGEIVACKLEEDKVLIGEKGELIVELIPCKWGQDSFIDLTPGSDKVYVSALPTDPKSGDGDTYVYMSNGYKYQILAALESSDESAYDAKIEAQRIMCGTRTCNMGKSYKYDEVQN